MRLLFLAAKHQKRLQMEPFYRKWHNFAPITSRLEAYVRPCRWLWPLLGLSLHLSVDAWHDAADQLIRDSATECSDLLHWQSLSP